MSHRYFPSLLFFVLGCLLAWLLVPYELEQMRWEVPGMPESYPIEQKMRPLLLLLLCFIPLIGSLIYAKLDTMERYLSRVFLNYFLLCTGILMLIYILADFTDNMERFRERFADPLGQTFVFYGTQLPMFLYQILPYTMLMGTLWCLSRLCAASELTGMLQSGRSLLRICRPIFIFGCLIALIYGICGFHWAPNGSLYRQTMLKQTLAPDGSQAALVYRSDATSRIWRIQHPASMQSPGTPMEGVIIEQFSPEEKGKLLYQIRADKAAWNKADASWTFTNASKRLVMTTEDILAGKRPRNDEHFESLRLPFDEKPYQIISPTQRRSNESMGTSALWEYLKTNAGSELDRARKSTEWHLRIARVFTCLVLVLLAIPNAITFQRRTAMKGIGLTMLMAAMLLFFYRVFPTLGESGILPAWLSAWIPNIGYTLVAIWFFQKNLAHRSSREWITHLKDEFQKRWKGKKERTPQP